MTGKSKLREAAIAAGFVGVYLLANAIAFPIGVSLLTGQPLPFTGHRPSAQATALPSSPVFQLP